MHYYILSGYNHLKKKLETKAFKGIDSVMFIINWWFKEAKMNTAFTDRDAFEAAVQSAGRNEHSFPIDTNPLVTWNVYYI